MAKVHEYPVTVNWQGGRTGSGQLTADRSQVTSLLAVPPEFGGNGQEGTNPEELLTSAIAGCYSITYGIVTSMRKLPIESFSCSAVGEVEEQGQSFTYKKVTLRPHIVLAADAEDSALKMAEDLAHKADAYCIVTNSVRGKVEIVLEPKVERA
jgi:peroxiredoxin-like protein